MTFGGEIRDEVTGWTCHTLSGRTDTNKVDDAEWQGRRAAV